MTFENPMFDNDDDEETFFEKLKRNVKELFSSDEVDDDSHKRVTKYDYNDTNCY